MITAPTTSNRPEIEKMFLGRYICQEGNSDKFWEISKIEVAGGEERYKIRYGANGRSGESYEATRDEAWKKLMDKLRPQKGYELDSPDYTESLRRHLKLMRVGGKKKLDIVAPVRVRSKI